MSKLLFIIGCSHKKADTARPAAEMYLSKRFLAAKEIAECYSSDWLILSAKHGVLSKSQIVEPYDITLDNLTNEQYLNWVSKCSVHIINETSPYDHVIFLGDSEYFQDISDSLILERRIVYMPLDFVPYPEQSRWLETHSSHRKYINKFYSLFDFYSEKYSLPQKFSDFNSKNCCPEFGLYLFLHSDEIRLYEPSRLRIARIGTHAVSEGSKSTLWQRLKTHKGTDNGFGNHRSSIFRSYIGSALINKNGCSLESWAQETNDKETLIRERELEKQVSDYLSKKFQVVCLNIPGVPSKTSDRAYIERNLIALLSSSNHFSDTPPVDWLGKYAPSAIVKKSGLWNVNHTDEIYTYEFFDILEEYFKLTCGLVSEPADQLAPFGWNMNRKSRQT